MSEESALMAVFHGFVFLIGLALGSFAQVAIVRWPDDRSVVAPRSQCPACGTPVRIRDNIPLWSWVWLRGRCRDCGWSIPATYPLTELLAGLVALLVFRRVFHGPEDFDPAHWAAFAVYFSFALMLLIGAYVDLKHYILPDEVTIYAVPAGLLSAWALGELGYAAWPHTTLYAALAGALGGGLLLGSIAVLSVLVAGREGMGWGDVKLVAMIGSFLGFTPGILFVLIFGSLTGSFVGIAHALIRGRRAPLPFGPPLAAAAVLYLLYGDTLIRCLLPTLYRLP